jgi:cytochrome c oxidase cbb3-type subunit I/II
LKDDFGFPIRPADLTTGQFKSGPVVQDIFRTMSTGLSGTPMPSFQQALPEEDRWALAYYVLSLSAFKDPLTGEPLNIPPEAKAALNDPALKASSSEQAYVPGAGNLVTDHARRRLPLCLGGAVRSLHGRRENCRACISRGGPGR